MALTVVSGISRSHSNGSGKINWIRKCAFGVFPWRKTFFILLFLTFAFGFNYLVYILREEKQFDMTKIKLKFDLFTFCNSGTGNKTRDLALAGKGEENSNFTKTSEPLVDQPISKTEEEMILEVAGFMRNVPLPPSYILGKNWTVNSDRTKNLTCARFPTFHDIEFSNTHWQTLKLKNGITFYLYAAYLDIRNRNKHGAAIRILSAIDRIQPNVTTYCQIWFENEIEPIWSMMTDYYTIWPKGGVKPMNEPGRTENGRPELLYPFLLSCPLPVYFQTEIPLSVSIVEEPCDAAKNNLRVIFDKPETGQELNGKGIVVCHKSLDFLFEDISVRLVEWIELMRVLGAEKIFFYEFAVHPNVSKVLRHYEKTGFIETTPITLPGGLPNEPKLRRIYLRKPTMEIWLNEPLAYNDCFYRNLYKYEYIAVFDLDEVIMPIKSSNWLGMMDDVKQLKKDRNLTNVSMAYTFRNFYFMDHMIDTTVQENNASDIPKYFHMLQHVHRSQDPLPPMDGPKSILDPQYVLLVHNHYPIRGHGHLLFVPVRFGRLQHYRKECHHVPFNHLSCANQSVPDSNIWRFKNQIMDRGQKTLRNLGFIS